MVVHYTSDHPNYTNADSSPVSFKIAPAMPKVSVTDAGGTYSKDPFPATDASVMGVGKDGKLASFGYTTLSYSYYNSAATLLAGAPTAAGAYTVVANYTSNNPNYTNADSSPVSFTIAAGGADDHLGQLRRHHLRHGPGRYPATRCHGDRNRWDLVARDLRLYPRSGDGAGCGSGPGVEHDLHADRHDRLHQRPRDGDD